MGEVTRSQGAHPVPWSYFFGRLMMREKHKINIAKDIIGREPAEFLVNHQHINLLSKSGSLYRIAMLEPESFSVPGIRVTAVSNDPNSPMSSLPEGTSILNFGFMMKTFLWTFCVQPTPGAYIFSTMPMGDFYVVQAVTLFMYIKANEIDFLDHANIISRSDFFQSELFLAERAF